jgi:nucleoside-diphosphate-sugar epimerase
MSAAASHPALRAYRGASVAVLGASGFIGRWVARALCAQGAAVRLVDRSRAAAARWLVEYGVGGEFIEADLTDQAALRALFLDAPPAIVFNLAGYGVNPAERDEALARRVNAELPAALCAAAAAGGDHAWPGQRIVHAGSAYEYGAIGGDLAEDSAPAPVTLYGRTKLEGTCGLAAACAERGVRGLTARLFMVYGPGEHPARLLPSLVETARTGATLPLTAGIQRRDFTYVEDVAEGLLRLGLSPAAPGEIVNLATGRLTTVRAFAETAARVLGIPAERLRFDALPTRVEEMAHAEVAVATLKRLTGWVAPTTVETGIRRAVAFGTHPAGRSA